MTVSAERERMATLDLSRIDAVLFDLDGVVTDTASVHAAAWKQVFDDVLRTLAARDGFEPSAFDAGEDYRLYVDGRPRIDGVEAFLASRGISLPRGDPEDPPDRETGWGVGNRKNAEFLRRIGKGGVHAFASTVELIRELRRRDVPIAIFSSSRNCVPVLESAGVLDLFDAKVDGLDAADLGLPGKPDPAVLFEAARRLGASDERSAVVEDALAGIRAGRRGGFGLVIAVDRVGRREAFREAGADVVVRDLGELQVVGSPVRAAGAVGWSAEALLGPAASRRGTWTLVYEGFDPEQEQLREALCTTGNGYFATRGAAPEAQADGVHYPGTYAAGVLNRLSTEIAGRTVENESIVNLPNWLPLTFRIERGPWFDLRKVELIAYEQELDLRQGVLSRRLRFRDGEGRHTRLVQRRFTSMDDPHLAALETTIQAEDWAGHLEIRSGIDGAVQNAGVARYRDLNGRHLEEVASALVDDETVLLQARTSHSRIGVAEVARTRLYARGRHVRSRRRVLHELDSIAHELSYEMSEGESISVEKAVMIYTSRDPAIYNPEEAARRALRRVRRFDELLQAHVAAWHHLWDRIRLTLVGAERSNFIINLHAFHLMQTVSENSVDLDVGVPARGLHGEAYHGHIFWDELFVLPYLSVNFPEVTRSLLRYRHRRLDEAREAARDAGYEGAMFPWQCGLDGREGTQTVHLNPRSGRWLRDNSRLQRHINIAVAHNFWDYYQTTGDIQFLSFYGAEVILEIARFWASIAEFDHARGRYVIRGVMGPDEYHDGYPGAGEPGLDNNAYTNVMAVWVLRRALAALEALSVQRRSTLLGRLGLGRAEIERWEDISRRMFVPFHDGGIISQFEGYELLEELDWEACRERYGDIQRLDRILEAEGDTPNRYKASKQADALMLFFLLSSEELGELFERLGYRLEADTIPRTIDYYARRTSHGSTLSRLVHSWVYARADRPGSYELFQQALQSDIADSQHGTTSEGIHLGAMAGTLDLVERCYAGLESRDDVLWINPSLPEEIQGLEFSIRWRRHWGIQIRIGDGRLRVSVPPSDAEPMTIAHAGRIVELRAGDTFEAALAG